MLYVHVRARGRKGGVGGVQAGPTTQPRGAHPARRHRHRGLRLLCFHASAARGCVAAAQSPRARVDCAAAAAQYHVAARVHPSAAFAAAGDCNATAQRSRVCPAAAGSAVKRLAACSAALCPTRPAATLLRRPAAAALICASTCVLALSTAFVRGRAADDVRVCPAAAAWGLNTAAVLNMLLPDFAQALEIRMSVRFSKIYLVPTVVQCLC